MPIIMVLFPENRMSETIRDYFLESIKDFKFSTILYILIIDL